MVMVDLLVQCSMFGVMGENLLQLPKGRQDVCSASYLKDTGHEGKVPRNQRDNRQHHSFLYPFPPPAQELAREVGEGLVLSFDLVHL